MPDFSAFEIDVDKPSRLTLLDQNGRPYRSADGKRTAWIDVHSMDSEIGRKHQRAIARKRLQSRVRLKLTPEELESENTDLLVALTVGWDLVVTDLPFSPENARALYENPKTVNIRRQVDEHAADPSNFASASSQS